LLKQPDLGDGFVGGRFWGFLFLSLQGLRDALLQKTLGACGVGPSRVMRYRQIYGNELPTPRVLNFFGIQESSSVWGPGWKYIQSKTSDSDLVVFCKGWLEGTSGSV